MATTRRSPRAQASAIVAFAVVAVVVVLAVWAFSRLHDVDPYYLAQEPQVVLRGKPYAGAVSRFGVVLWTVAMATSGLAAALVRERDRQMFLGAAVVSAMFLFEHLFRFSEVVRLEVGTSGILLGLVYVAAGLGLLVRFRAELGPTAVAGLVGSGALLLTARAINRWHNYARFNLDEFTEASIAFVGIAVWAGVWTGLALSRLAASPPD